MLLGFLFLYLTAFSQEKNPFYMSDHETSVQYKNDENQFAAEAHDDDPQNLMNSTGPPGDDDAVPINNYSSFLFIAAVLMIGYIGTKKHRIKN